VGRTIAAGTCGNWAIKGGTVCNSHGGGAPQVKKRAAVVAELHNWGLGDPTVDPGEVLLRLVTQSVNRAERYAAELAAMVEKEPSLRDALIGDAYGEFGKTAEFIRGLARVEAEERDRCTNFAAKAVAAGLNERMVRLAEEQGAMLVKLFKAVLDDPDLVTEGQKQVARLTLAREMRALSSA
jgi:hypothetical protein